MNQHLEKIEAVCKKAIPEIMEPKFGCRILVHLPHSELICRVIKESDNGSIMLDYSSFWWTKEQLSYAKKFEILGRDIQLADVLRTIDKSIYAVDCDGDFLQQIINDDGYREWISMSGRWNLSKDNLRDQFPETWEFIAGLLPNAK